MLELFIAYFSIPLGKILNYLSKEEMNKAKKYILTSQKILMVLISLLLVYNSFSLLIIPFLISGFILFYYLRQPYLLFGLLAFLSLFTSPILLLSLTSLLLLTHSSLSPYKLKPFLLSSLFFILPFSLLLIETFINQNSGFFIGLASGGLLAQLMGP